ncbi:hypothetical protein Y032_0711g1734 [Ancylostoma ceylanicum]|uniref:Uncharacterized protein n=1 Tax=Ancylostoma ceylanicum TaxID=53326 RepID=A0A016WGY9_9BILA|nr:hypothetical protein Y032_0711g1734 [Ancylostoma ceylanicum]
MATRTYTQCRSSPLKFAALLMLSTLTMLGIIASQHTTLTSTLGSLLKAYAAELQSGLVSEETVENDDLPFHPFENSCKFPMPNTYATDIAGNFRLAERLRQLQCPYENFDFATMDSEGYMYVHPHYARYRNVTTGVACNVVFLEGALRNKTTNRGKNDIKEVAVVEAPVNTRFFANGDAFYIRCYRKGKQIFEQVYAGIRDLEREPNRIYIAKDMESFDDYGRRRKFTKKLPSPPQRYSIDILGFDSTSRTMFMRHLPRTMETMNELGYELLYGYNKKSSKNKARLHGNGAILPEMLRSKQCTTNVAPALQFVRCSCSGFTARRPP